MTKDRISKPPLQAYVPNALALQLIMAPQQTANCDGCRCNWSQSLCVLERWAWSQHLDRQGAGGSPQCQARWCGIAEPHSSSLRRLQGLLLQIRHITAPKSSEIYVSCTSRQRTSESLKPTNVSEQTPLERVRVELFPPHVKQVSMPILILLQLVTDQPKQEQLLHISTLSFTSSFLTVL